VSVRLFIRSRQLRPVSRDGLFAEADVLRLAPDLRALSASSTIVSEPALFAASPASRRQPLPLVVSVGMQGLLIALSLWLTADVARTQNAPGRERPRMVFLSIPGPGGGGGGSGARQRPAPPLERAAGLKASVATPPAALTPRSTAPDAPAPKPAVARATSDATAKPAEPLPSRTIIAPVVMTASHTRDRDGIADEPNRSESNTKGIGTGGRVGSGQGEGNGEGLGSGLDAGSGGGTGGGAYRPGTGIEAPRLLREVKADYTESARRRQIEGEVELEVVINRDGSVGQVTVTKGLGEGLDQRAVAAVRQWQFAPARRRGEPVDVVVDVSVEFKLR
jgi:protein TonB